jgi:TolA-binding protein
MLFWDGKYAQSQDKFSYLIQEFPRSPYYRSALLKIGLAHYNLNNTNKALKQFKAIIKQYPSSEEAKKPLLLPGEILIDQGKGEEVIELAPNLTKSFQDSTLYHSAFSFVKKNDHENAILNLEKYLQKYPNGYFVVNAHYYLANSAYTLNNQDKALQLLKLLTT